MLSKAQAKQIRALHRKKNRQDEGLFLVEGEKIVVELLRSDWRIHSLFATPTFLEEYKALVHDRGVDAFECDAEALTKTGTLRSNNAALAVVHMAPEDSSAPTGWTLALEDINDPGNLGAILRIADWYGFSDVMCSPQTVELYNPKVIAASKGSFLRVRVHYRALDGYFETLPQGTDVFGAYLDGESVHTLRLASGQGVVLMGSEAHGISDTLAPYVTRRITIPSFGNAESLNVGIATAIICDNLRRLQDT